jgi:hypothetical protein
MHTFVRVRACMERTHTQASVAERAKNVVEQPGLPVPLVHMRLSAPIQLSIFPSCHLRAARARLLNHVQTSKGPSKKYNRPIAIRVTCYYQHTWSMTCVYVPAISHSSAESRETAEGEDMCNPLFRLCERLILSGDGRALRSECNNLFENIRCVCVCVCGKQISLILRGSRMWIFQNICRIQGGKRSDAEVILCVYDPGCGNSKRRFPVVEIF